MNSFFKRNVGSLLRWYQKEIQHIFTSINIETYGFCNRKCTFCFNHDSFPNREKGIMDDALFYKIIDELGRIHFAGRISPILYGEPLLDKRTVDFIRYISKRVPFSDIWLNTNGDFLTEKLLNEMITSGLDKIYVTNYDEKEKKHLEYLADKYNSIVVYKNMYEKRIVNRAGFLFDYESKNRNKPCLQPYGQAVINWEGDVLLCCNDYYAKYTFGNLKEISLLESWNNVRFKKYRKILLEKGGRQKIDLCRNCDS